MRRIIKFVGYTFSTLGIVLLILWAIRGARPALDCGLVDAVSAQDWGTAYACLDESDYDPLIGFVTLISGGLLALAARFAPGGDKSKEYNPTLEERQNNRKELIRRVRSIWIDGYLNQSLYQEVLLSLGMEWNRADPLPAHYGMKAKRQNHAPALDLAAGPQMATFYEQVNHQLLILGAPGAGKTTVMLDLAKSYLDSADSDADVPVPVILTLSSWPGKEMPFDDWLVSEMRVRYGNDITDKVARYWLEHNEVALFLDGLDELPADRRDDAVTAVEAYRNSALGRWFVVCSRSAEYGALANGFAALDSVEIEPVTPAQIQGYLAELDGEQPRQLAATIAGDDTLKEVADTPLMLNVMLLAADAVDWRTLPTDEGTDVARAFIYDSYIEEMLVRPRMGAQYAAAKTLKWLQWLAQEMVEHGQTVYLMERMNRSWLNRRLQGCVWALIFGLISALVGIPLVWLMLGFFTPIAGLIAGPIAGPIAGAIAVLIAGFGNGLSAWREDIHVKEKLSFEPNLGRLTLALIAGLIAGLILGLVFTPIAGLIFGLTVWLTAGLIYGMTRSTSTLELSYRSARPNHGIQQSLRNGLILGLPFGLIAGLILGLIFTSIAGAIVVPMFGLAVGLVYGLAVGLDFGLETVIKHYTLRLVLWLDGSMPLNYIRFLDACAGLILLRKVGGAYMFPHIMFRDYFAALTPEGIDALVQRIEARQEN